MLNAMRFDAATVIFVTVCIVAAVGSQIQAKTLLNLFNTPILVAWIISVFLLVAGPAQWLCGCQDERSEKKRQLFSRLLMIMLHMADISAYFLAINFCSVRVIAGMQVKCHCNYIRFALLTQLLLY